MMKQLLGIFSNATRNVALLLLGGLVLAACSDADDISKTNVVRHPINFVIDLTQDVDGTRAAKRGDNTLSAPRCMQMESSDGSAAFMQETNLNIIDDFMRAPMRQLRDNALAQQSANGETPQTRGTLVTEVSAMSQSGFSSWCYYANGQLYYENVQSDNHGNLSMPKEWEENKDLLFYAIHPFDAKKVDFGGAADAFTYNFTVNTDVSKQEDLMYAATGVLPYNEEGLAPLHFQHALTAVRFAFGNNPDFNKTISSITIKGIHTKGTYVLPAKATEESGYSLIQGHWTNINSETTDITLSGLSAEATQEHANQMITLPDQTFLLLPSDNLSGVSFVVTFTDNSNLTYNFTANDKWFSGHTYTYKLSKKAENYKYCLNILGDCDNGMAVMETGEETYYDPGYAYYYNISYDENTTRYYCLVNSYKYLDNNTKVAVPWEVVEYEYSFDGGTTWTSTGKRFPEWLLDFPEAGLGSTSWQGGYPEFAPNTLVETETGEAAARTEKILAKSTRGTSGNRFDLSTHDIKGNSTPRNTANSYVIAAPGYYKLPLVYGNAITDGATNSEAYSPTKPTPDEVLADVPANRRPSQYNYNEDMDFLSNFINYKGTAITNPWIEIDGTPATAELVWADRQSLQAMLSSNLQVVQEGGHYYLYFDAADKDKIKQGNAVVAVKDQSGTVMWSWHLWFAPDDVLETTTVTSYTSEKNNVHEVANETLGYTLLYSIGTPFSERMLRAKVQQKEGDEANGPLTGYIRIRQMGANTNFDTHATLYQFGRKDALSGTNTFYPEQETFPVAATASSYADAIKNPGTFFNGTNGQWVTTAYSNVWAGRFVHIYDVPSDYINTKVLKTVYDPCPPGYSMPTPRTFVDFGVIKTHKTDEIPQEEWDYDGGPRDDIVKGSWDNGWHFWADNTRTSTVYIPYISYRNGNSLGTNTYSRYHYALPQAPGTDYSMEFGTDRIIVFNNGIHCATACAVRPVKEE